MKTLRILFALALLGAAFWLGRQSAQHGRRPPNAT